ncbi:Myb-like_DNA-binding domain-containing protein [Hexamita inflata]|uniref:Myb-like DNA-binding domain-containing protein n=1 Tax=Hexamita inflata TaxID=28002 RepID=A0AA86UDH6_9EUKA|nr:Myb-like DNA-binding domain-containing protein [Hexamita inflata]
MRKVSWTVPEIEHLTQLTEHSRKFDKKIDWDVVAAQIPSRTASQCKSYYANVLKKTLDVQIRQNHRWNRVEIIALWALCVNFDKDYAFIQQNYIPNMSVKQISSQFIQIQNKHQEMYQIFQQILVNPQYIQKLNLKDFQMQWWILQAAARRKKLIDVKINNKQDNVPVSNFPVDIFEVKSMNMFFLEIEINDLIPIYKEEERRRGLQNQPFQVPKYQASFHK